jgi:hypothetical protein
MTACSQPDLSRDTLSYNATLTGGVYLVIPGLLAPEAVGSTPVKASPLGKYLNWSEKTTDIVGGGSAGLESRVARWFNADSGPAAHTDPNPSNLQQSYDESPSHHCNAAARLGYYVDIADDADPVEVFRADPVYQQMDINHATLADQSLLNLSDAESAAIIASLNTQFASDGLTFSAPHPQRWYCEFQEQLSIDTVSLSSAVGRDVALFRPTGTGARRWRTLLAEIEMILHAHPVNQQREAQGLLPVNSLWLWGEGELPERRSGGAVYSGNFYTQSLANFSGLTASSIGSFSIGTLPALVVDDRLLTIAATGNTELYQHVVEELADCVFAPLVQSRSVLGNAPPVTLWCGGDTLWQLPPRINWRRWLRSQWHPPQFEQFVEAGSQRSGTTEVVPD